jgi:RNA polymerase sigma factor for flagellar operon FliA
MTDLTTDRERLISDNVLMARCIARKMGRHVDPTLRSDLEATALMGLVEAASRFDFSRPEPFTAFAYRRIRGAVLDGMRRGDFLPRRVRSLSKKANRAIARLEQQLGREPDEGEVSAELGLDVETYRRGVNDARRLSFVDIADETSIAGEDDPFDRATRKQLSDRMRSALGTLETRDAQLLSLYYVEELTYAEIGKVFRVSEARICQLHSRALKRLRAALD